MGREPVSRKTSSRMRAFVSKHRAALVTFILGGALVSYLTLALDWRRLRTEEAGKGLHLYPQLRFVLDRRPGDLPQPPMLSAQGKLLSDIYVPHGDKPAEAPVTLQIGMGNPFTPIVVLVNDGDGDATRLSVQHFYLLFDRRRLIGAYLVVALEEGTPANEERHRRPGADWIYTPTLASRAEISKPTVFPMSEFNPKGDFLDVYWVKARYYRENDPNSYTVERVFVYDQGRILNEDEMSRWDEYGAIKGAVKHIVGENGL